MPSASPVARSRIVPGSFAVAVAVALLAASGCVKGDAITNGTGGGAATGGGGSNGSGSGGSTPGSGTGGTPGAGVGGGTGTGGTPGAGVGGGSGTGTGGTPGAGVGGDNNPASFIYDFKTSAQGFALSNYADTGATNLGAPNSGSSPTATFDGTDGNPDPGSLKVAATFTAYNQYVDAVINISPGLALTGKTIHAKVKLVSGAFTGGVTLHAGTTSTYVYGAGAFTALTQGQWLDLALDLTKVTTVGWDASQVVQIGIQFATGSGPTGGTFAGPVAAVFQIDTITDGGGSVGPVALAYNFDTTALGFTLSNYADPNATNLGSATSGSSPTATFDGTDGNPSPGSLKIAATFTAYNQYVDAVVGLAPPPDLSGQILHAKVRLTAGAFTGGVQLHASTTTNYVYGAGTFTALTLGDWIDLTVDLSSVTAAGWDPTQVVQIGLSFATGSGPEGGAFAGPVNAIFHVDSITQ